MDAKQLLGVDVGKVRTGVARASMVARIAEPLTTVRTAQAIPELEKLVDRHGIDTLVVGLPRGLNGDETEQTTWVRQWVSEAKAKVDKPFYWQDEALTTRLAEMKALTHKKPADVDALAAAIILQDFLESPETARALA